MHDSASMEKILELKERASEDIYFAARDRELIAKLKQSHESELEETIRELVRARCPQCGVRLEHHPFQGVTMMVCRVCHGAWFNNEQLQVITQESGQSWAKEFVALMSSLMKPPTEDSKMKPVNLM